MRSIVAASIIILTGCVSVRPVSQQAAPHEKREVNERNYQLGIAQESVVGSPMVRLRRYVPRAVVSTVYTVTEPCRVHLALRYDHTFAPGDAVPLLGDSPCGDATCRLVRLDTSPLHGDLGALIAPDGKMQPRPINLTLGNKQLGTIHTEPDTCRFVAQEQETRATPSPDYRNFEIIYGGIDGATLRFTYREYSADDLARPAFAQTFSYPVGTAQVRFKDVRVRIVDAQPDVVRYVVEDDGATTSHPLAPRAPAARAGRRWRRAGGAGSPGSARGWPGRP